MRVFAQKFISSDWWQLSSGLRRIEHSRALFFVNALPAKRQRERATLGSTTVCVIPRDEALSKIFYLGPQVRLDRTAVSILHSPLSAMALSPPENLATNPWIAMTAKAEQRAAPWRPKLASCLQLFSVIYRDMAIICEGIPGTRCEGPSLSIFQERGTT